MNDVRIFHKVFETKTQKKKNVQADREAKVFYYVIGGKRYNNKKMNIIINPKTSVVIPKPRIWVCCEIPSSYVEKGYLEFVSVLFYSSSLWIVRNLDLGMTYLILRLGYDVERVSFEYWVNEFVRRNGKRMTTCLVDVFEYIKQKIPEVYGRVSDVHDYVMCLLLSDEVSEDE